jgi:aldose 1-epimerase
MIQKESDPSGIYLTLTNDVGLSLTLSELGAGIYEIAYDGKKMSIAPSTHRPYEVSSAYFGKTIGRISGRIKDAILPWRGKEYEIGQNEGFNTLHGGPRGFSYQAFGLVDHYENEKELVAKFNNVSFSGDMGFPGEVEVNVIYTLSKTEPTFTITYEIASKEATPVGLTNHTYFNLGGKANVTKDFLQVKADAIYELDEEMIPLKPIALSPLFDLNKGKTIGEIADDPSLIGTKPNGLDHIYRLKQEEGPKVILENDDYRLEIQTDFPCCCIYADNYPRDGMILNTGLPEERHSGDISLIFLTNFSEIARQFH